MTVAEKFRKALERLESRFKKGDRSGKVLTLLALAKLRERGEKATPEKIVEEARKIMEETPRIKWGVEKDEYNVGLASSILKELLEAGLIVEVDGAYYFIRQEGLDPVAEVYRKFGHLLFYGGPAR